MQKRTLVLSWITLLLAAFPAFSQSVVEGVPTALDCPPDVAGYTLRTDAIVHTPFNLLGSLKPAIERVRSRLPHKDENYSVEAAAAGSDAIRNELQKEGGNARFRARVTRAYYTHCDASEKKLDVVYEVFQFSIEPPRLRLYESALELREDPSRTAEGKARRYRLSIRPKASYNASDLFSAGTVVSYAVEKGLLRTIDGEFEKSKKTTIAALHLEGSANYLKWASSANWKLAYDYLDGPSEEHSLRRGRGLAQFSAVLPAVWQDSTVFRMATSFEFGNQQSDFEAAPATDTVASASYSSWKLSAGATGRTDRHALTASYGLQLGSIAGGRRLDFHKHLADVGWDYRQPFGDHRTFELEMNLLLGKLKVPGRVPVGERFFGGNVPQPFLISNDWQFRGAPVIRSIPNRTLSRLAPGSLIGGESYAAINLTVGPTVWRIPLLPDEVGGDPQFPLALDLAKREGQTSMIPMYKAEVPRLDSEIQTLKEIAAAVPALVAGIAVLEREKPALEWFECRFISNEISSTAETQQTETGDLGETSAAVDNAADACREGEKMSGAEFNRLFGTVKVLSDKLEADYEARPAVQEAVQRATADFKVAERAIDLFVKEMNLFSISPLFVFDAARIGPQTNAAGGGVRYGIGGGVRFSLVSHVNFDIGYAVNPKPTPWEGRGALFFQMKFLELMR